MIDIKGNLKLNSSLIATDTHKQGGRICRAACDFYKDVQGSSKEMKDT